MALSIGISTGSKIDVGGHIVAIRSILEKNLIVLSVDGGTEMVISDQARTEVLPEVFVFSGVSQYGGGTRLAFEAPLSIRISRVAHEVVHEDQ